MNKSQSFPCNSSSFLVNFTISSESPRNRQKTAVHRLRNRRFSGHFPENPQFPTSLRETRAEELTDFRGFLRKARKTQQTLGNSRFFAETLGTSREKSA